MMRNIHIVIIAVHALGLLVFLTFASGLRVFKLALGTCLLSLHVKVVIVSDVCITNISVFMLYMVCICQLGVAISLWCNTSWMTRNVALS